MTSPLTPADAVEVLAACRNPTLIGVRHHSPALAWAIAPLLDAFLPDRLLIELPAELQDWLDWVSHPDVEAPIALAAARRDGNGLAFYPFADFSPELAALRWARAHGVPVEAIDLPVGAKRGDEASDVRKDWEGKMPRPGAGGGNGGLIPFLLGAEEADGVEDLWDRLVEAHAPGSSPESLRRAGLSVGWALRRDASEDGAIPDADLRREAWMAQQIGRVLGDGSKVAVVVGAFHAPALAAYAGAAVAGGWPVPEAGVRLDEVVTSLVAYEFELLDSRSGYPAGIRDPAWQQRVFDSAGDPDAIADAAARAITTITAELRRLGHPAGVPDAREALRVAEDLARLRQLPAPGRRELVESVHTALVQGELLGRGRVVARAMEHALVGRRRGRLASGTPRSGLVDHVESLLADLRLPGPDEAIDAVEIRLDPLRSPLDRRRHLALRRLEACGVPYGRLISGAGAAPEALTFRWSLRWQPATPALLVLAGIRGVTLAQATEGSLRANYRTSAEAQGEVGAALTLLEAAAECGLPSTVTEALTVLAEHGPSEGTLAQDLAGVDLLERVASGLVPGFPPQEDRVAHYRAVSDDLLSAALRVVDGLAGSDHLEDARALAALVFRLATGDHDDERTRLGWSLDRMVAGGGPLMQGVAEIARVLLGRCDPVRCGAALGSWIDGAGTREAQRTLAERLRGVLVTAASVLESSSDLLSGLTERVEAIDDDGFLRRLPALRQGFDVLSSAARRRFFLSVGERLGIDGHGLDRLEHDALTLGRWAAADAAGRGEVAAFDVTLLTAAAAPASQSAVSTPTTTTEGRPTATTLLSPIERWRLILGQQEDHPDQFRRIAGSLDELYGAGRGEGSRSGIASRGGSEARYPSVREWSEELEAIFGTEVCQEVLAVAAGHGRVDVALAIDPEAVQPSVELLQQLLSLKGGLSEADLTRLRRLVNVIVADLVRQLATRLRPALTGTVTNRATRRPGGPLDLRRTIAANLHTVTTVEPSTAPSIAAERLWFKTRSRRSLDWRVVLVVDVSGSMEASVIYAALMAAIINGIPAVTAHFVAFASEVVDLSERVEDPLALLLEIRVGGGTHIAKGLRYARTLITVPARTIVVLISDFEEGGPVGELLAEVRLLAEAGAHPLGLAALDDQGAPRYSVAIAEQVVAAGMPVAALSPLELARWIGERIR